MKELERFLQLVKYVGSISEIYWVMLLLKFSKFVLCSLTLMLTAEVINMMTLVEASHFSKCLDESCRWEKFGKILALGPIACLTHYDG